jgi:HPr kinase/phosphorylase
LILGKPGAGKSALALELMALGADLVADDRVVVTPDAAGGPPMLSPPERIAGRIEARGIGIVAAPWAHARAALVVDLDRTETARLPEAREIVIGGTALTCLSKLETPAFPAMVLAVLKGGRVAP